MNIYEYQRSRSFINFGSRSLKFNIFKLLFLRNCWADRSQIFIWSLHRISKWKIVQIVQVTWSIWPPCPYLVKTFKKNLLLWNQMADDLESWYAASGTQVQPSCLNDNPGLTLTYFTSMSNLVHYAFLWGKGKTIVVCDLKVGRCSQLNECMNFYEYQRSRSFMDLRPRSLRFNIFKLPFFIKPPGRLKPNFMWSLRGMRKERSTNGLCHMTKMAAMSFIHPIGAKEATIPTTRTRSRSWTLASG